MNKFINAGKVLTTAAQKLFICPADTSAVVHTLFFASTDNENSKVTVEVFDFSENTTFTIAKNMEVLAEFTSSIDKPINLEERDEIRVYADDNGKIHAFASILHVIPASL